MENVKEGGEMDFAQRYFPLCRVEEPGSFSKKRCLETAQIAAVNWRPIRENVPEYFLGVADRKCHG